MKYIECELITGEALCEDIKQTLLKLSLRLEDTVSQAYDGAANFSGHTKGCASRFQSIVPHAEYFHCSSHDLNLALCHTCHDIPEIRNMINCVTELGLFFKYSPKRVRVLKAMDQAHVLTKNLTESTFLVTLRVCAYTLGFTKPLSAMLQGTSMNLSRNSLRHYVRTVTRLLLMKFGDHVKY